MIGDVGVILLGAGIIGAVGTFATVKVIGVHIDYIKNAQVDIRKRTAKLEDAVHEIKRSISQISSHE